MMPETGQKFEIEKNHLTSYFSSVNSLDRFAELLLDSTDFGFWIEEERVLGFLFGSLRLETNDQGRSSLQSKIENPKSKMLPIVNSHPPDATHA